MVMQGGLAMHAGRPFFPSDICAELQALPRPRGLVTTPVHLRVLLAEASELPAVDFPALRDRAAFSPAGDRSRGAFRSALHEIYGCPRPGRSRPGAQPRPRSGGTLPRGEPACRTRRGLG